MGENSKQDLIREYLRKALQLMGSEEADASKQSAENIKDPFIGERSKKSHGEDVVGSRTSQSQLTKEKDQGMISAGKMNNCNHEMVSKINGEAAKQIDSSILREEFINAQKNCELGKPNLIIQGKDCAVHWDMERFNFILNNTVDMPFEPKSPSPSVNPSLWYNAGLNMQTGLFKVTEDIYQVRNYDLANTTFVRCTGGWIVMDVLTTTQSMFAAYQLVQDNLPEPHAIIAIVYSHCHVDHYSGGKGLFIENIDANPETAKIPKGLEVYAPDGFLEHAVSENVIAGTAMNRRAMFYRGARVDAGEQGNVGVGLGMATASGYTSLIPPTRVITEEEYPDSIGEVKVEFQLTPGNEAPAEMNTFFPDLKVADERTGALWMAENTTVTMHNILTLRGAQVRDSLIWARNIQKSIDLFGDRAHVKFQSHHYPVWEQEKVIANLKMQRDCYKHLHDQSVRLMNQGYVDTEIADIIRFPPALEKDWGTKGFYGTLKHNSRAVYQFYMGWYDAHPSNLDNLPPVAVAKRYVKYMGRNVSEILCKIQDEIDAIQTEAEFKDTYRWAAEALKHVVYSYAANDESPMYHQAKSMLAAVFTQLALICESGVWRCIYLEGAKELMSRSRHQAAGSILQPDVLSNMSLENMYDYIAVRVVPDWDTDDGDGPFHFLMVAIPDPDVPEPNVDFPGPPTAKPGFPRPISVKTLAAPNTHIWTFENQTPSYTDAMHNGTEGTITFLKRSMGNLISATRCEMKTIIDKHFEFESPGGEDGTDVKSKFVKFMMKLDFPNGMFPVVLPRPDPYSRPDSGDDSWGDSCEG